MSALIYGGGGGEAVGVQSLHEGILLHSYVHVDNREYGQVKRSGTIRVGESEGRIGLE